MRALGSLFFFTGRIGPLAYWCAAVATVLAFIVTALAFPVGLVLIPVFGYLAFCLLANRLRDAGLPGILAVIPFGLIAGTLLLYAIFTVLAFGGAGPRAAQLFLRNLEWFGEEVLIWLLAAIYACAGLLARAEPNPDPEATPEPVVDSFWNRAKMTHG